MDTDYDIIDNVSADTLGSGDQVIIEGDLVEISNITYTDDVDEVVVHGYSHIEGDTVTYSLYADDFYDIWSI